jgi:hypothetical protein
MSGRSRRRLRRGRGLLGIVGFFAAACEQAEGRAQQTGQDEFLHGMDLFFSEIAAGIKIRNRPVKKLCTGCFRKSVTSSANLTSLTDVWFWFVLSQGMSVVKACMERDLPALTYSTLPERNFSAASVRERTCSL